MVLSSYVTPGPYFERTVRTSSKSLNGRKIARMAPILTIFGPNRSRRRDLFFEKFSNERRRHRRLVVVSSSPSSSPSSPPSSPQHNYSRSQLPRTAIIFEIKEWRRPALTAANALDPEKGVTLKKTWSLLTTSP